MVKKIKEPYSCQLFAGNISLTVNYTSVYADVSMIDKF